MADFILIRFDWRSVHFRYRRFGSLIIVFRVIKLVFGEEWRYRIYSFVLIIKILGSGLFR